MKLVTIFGGSGFVGRYIARRMAREDWRVRVAVRRPEQALFVRAYGVVGQVEPVFCNIRDDESVRAVMHGADAAVNCVGTFDAKGKNSFGPVQHEGAARIARIAAEARVAHLVHISAIGADPAGASLYAQSKGRGEAEVQRHFPGAMILRPSVVFGPEDRFFNRFAGMARLSPFIPVIGAETRFQPVYADDVAQAAVLGATGRAAPGIYELGGPEVMTFRELMQMMLKVINRRRAVIGLPFWLGRIIAFGSGVASTASFGLVQGPITTDQVRSLRHDNVVGEGARGFADLGLHPTAISAVLPSYLWRFRPSGQFDAIKDSARNLRT